ncbi:hypothetical protein [Salisediminibacterium beveridgei]|uniref:Uncharacterized protein n=1 Tax=Salisediminibacterium beveridgei TaxID=632773 RepID=A0A1D7QYV3_9BACI|nr:hypothetical protein [Salisediminibacterium beveridgei]AOM84196.1 hypothetical protein BBEV_2871 [Salisediminibacterium beveridgei]
MTTIVLYQLLIFLVIGLAIYLIYKSVFVKLMKISKNLPLKTFGVFLIALAMTVPFALTLESDKALERQVSESGMIEAHEEEALSLIEAGDRERLLNEYRTMEGTFARSAFSEELEIRNGTDYAPQTHVVLDIDPDYGDDISVIFVYPHSEFNERVVTDLLPEGSLELVTNSLWTVFEDRPLEMSSIEPMFAVKQFTTEAADYGMFSGGGLTASSAKPILWIQAPDRVVLSGYNEITRIERQEEQ